MAKRGINLILVLLLLNIAPLECALANKTVINTASLVYTSPSNEPFPSQNDTATLNVDDEPPRATIIRPKTGNKLSGGAVVIEATSQDADIASIKYQYRSSNPGVWTEIVSSTKTGSIFSVTWNNTNLQNGNYDLRAVAKDVMGNTDPDSPIITVAVDHSTPDYSEDIVKKAEDNLIENGDGTKVEIPAGALNSDTIIKISKPDQAELPPPKDNPTGLYLKIELESKQEALNKPVTISMPYPDVDNNGIVDGTNILEENLKVNIYVNPNWVELPTTVDTLNNIAKGTTTHFTIFGVFGAVAPDLDDVVVYPNPFKPGRGDSVIRFLNLTSNVTIRIYNVAGELASIKEDITTGAAEWDGKNDYGEKVASGVYIYIITDDEGRKKTGKIVVVW